MPPVMPYENSLAFSCDPVVYDEEEEDPSKFSEEVCEVLGFLQSLSNPGVGVEALLSVLSRNPKSETVIARRFRISRAAVSKVMGVVRDHYGIVPRCGRSDESRKRVAVRRIGARKENKTWIPKAMFLNIS